MARKAEVIVTCNVKQAQFAAKVLEMEYQKLKAQYDKLVAAGKESDAATKALKRDMDSLSSAVQSNVQNMNRVKAVMDNLSGSTLYQLKAALREVKKQLRGKSEDSAGLAELKTKYKAITDQIKLLEGETVNVKKGIKDLTSQTDSWLQRAISQQKEALAQTKQGTLAYQQQLGVLKQLTAEQQRRSLTSIQSQGTAALQQSTAGMSATALRDRRAALTAMRDNIGTGKIDFGADQNLEKIKMINAALKQTDQAIEAINGKEHEVERSAEAIVEDIKKIDFKAASPKELKTKLDEVNRTLDKMAQKDPMRKQLVQSAKQLQTALANVDKEAVDIDRVLKNLKKASLDDLKKAAAQLEKEMAQCERNTKAFAEKRDQVRKLKQEIDNVTGSVKKQEGAWKKTFQAITAYLGVTTLISKIQQLLTNVIKLNLKFSDQLADIRKVSGLAMEDINQLSTKLAKIDTRTTIEELNQIAYAGAKLGIGKYGIDGLEGFVKAANQVNVALKEDLGADALTALSKITEVMGLIPKMGVEKSMLATGSAMFQLSASSTATAGNIVEFSKRLTGLAKVTGVTTDQLLGLASASDAMYLMPEVSATAFNKLFTSLQTKHNLIEKELSIAPGTINDLYSAGRAMDAMVLIFEKMKEKGNMNALQGVFKDLGSDGARLVNVMVTMSQNVDMLKDHLYIAQEAFEEGTAVTNEYNIQQETAAALMERASNVWEKAFVNPEGVDNVKGMAQAWYDMSNTLTHSTLYMAQLKLALDGILLLVKMLIYLLPTLLQFFLFKGAYVAVVALWRATKSLCVAIWQAVTAQKALNTAMKANVIGLILSLVATAIAYFVDFGDALNDAADAQKNLNDYMEEAAANFDKERRKLESFVKVLDDANTSQEERERIIKKFNHEYQTYITKLGIEINSVDALKKNYQKLNDEIKKKMYYQMKERAYDDKLGSASGRLGNAVMDYSKYVNSGNAVVGAGFDTKYVQSQIDAGKDAQAIYRQMIEASYGTSAGVWSNYDGSYIRNDGRGTTIKDDKLLAYITNMVNASKNYTQTKTDIDKAFDPIIGDYNPFKDDILGGLDKDAEDKEAKKKAAEAARKQREEWRKQLAEQKDQAKAVMDNIKNFYTRQMAELIRQANESEGQVSETMLNAQLDQVRNRMDLALAQARKGIAGAKNSWNEFKKTMKSDMIEVADELGYNESQVLLNEITTTNLDALRSKLVFLSGKLHQQFNAVLDEIWKNASVNELNREKRAFKQSQERLKAMLEDNYKGKVDYEHTVSMEKLGYFDLNERQTRRMALDPNLKDKRKTDVADIIATATDGAEQLSEIGSSNPDKLLEFLFGKDWAKADMKTNEVLRNILSLTTEEFEQFFDQLQGATAGGKVPDILADMMSEDLFVSRQKAIDAMFMSVRNNIVDIYAIGDASTEDGKNKLMTILFGPDWQTADTELSEVLNKEGQEMQLFYQELIKYYDDYVEAIKKGDDRKKKLIDFQWERSEEKQSLDAKSRDNELYQQGILQHRNPEEAEKQPSYGAYGNSRFVSSFGADPEIEAYRLKIEAAKAYYDFMEAHGATAEQLREQEKAVIEAQSQYVQQLAQKIKSQMDDVLKMTEPIESFGSKAGEAFALMTEDAEAGRKALKAAVGDMINDFLKQTVEMTKDYLKRRIMQKVHDRLTAVEAQAHETELTSIQSAGDATRLTLHETVQTGMTTIDQTQAAVRETTNVTEHAEELGVDAAAGTAEVAVGTASGAAKTIGSLGWWGIPLVAVITALLGALLSFAMSKVSKFFGSSDSGAGDTGPQTKLVSGMLTYDSGNVQAFRGVEDGKTYPVVGSDGKVYAAKDAGELSTGLVEDPITTLVNGQPALVAEKGPEMVIGRETTAAMMMARPDILAEIVKFDRQRSGRTYRAFDAGNVAEYASVDADSVTVPDYERLNASIDVLSAVLATIQKNGIRAVVNKYGRGGVVDEAESGRNFMQRNSGDRIWKG